MIKNVEIPLNWYIVLMVVSGFGVIKILEIVIWIIQHLRIVTI